MLPFKSQATLCLSKIIQQNCDQVENWTYEIQFQTIINDPIIIGYIHQIHTQLMQYKIKSSRCIAPFVCPPETWEAKWLNDIFSSEDADFGIVVRARSFSAVQKLCTPTIAKYSTIHKWVFRPQRAGGHFHIFAGVLLHLSRGNSEFILGMRESLVQNARKIFQVWSETQAFLHSGEFSLILSFASSWVISPLFLVGLINSPLCRSTAVLECPNTGQAIGSAKKNYCWLACYLFLVDEF